MNKEQLDEILKKHLKWLNDEPEGERADLSHANLRSANLSHAVLSFAVLSFADLRFADLRSANLRHADLRRANLRHADLSSADLRSADLRFANLRSTDLRYADLRSANILYFTLNRNTAYFLFDGMIRIGCEHHNVSYWKDHYQQIGEKAGYSDTEIMAYGNMIELCFRLQVECDADK